jgi:hypothetical protein
MTQRPMSVGTLCAFALLSFTFTISASAQSAKWKRYISKHGKFSVLLPGIPKTDYMKRVSEPQDRVRQVPTRQEKTMIDQERASASYC